MATYVTTPPSPSSSSQVRPLYRVVQLIWYLVGILEALLAFRFVLKLLGANPAAGFTNFIYSITQPFAAPFLNVFRIPRAEGSVLEWTTLLAMLVYFLIAYAIVKLLAMSRPVSRTEAAESLKRQDY